VNVQSVLGHYTSLERGKHSLFLYDDYEFMESVFLNYIRQGISHGECIIYLAGLKPVDDVKLKLQKAGIDPDDQRCPLTVVCYDSLLLENGAFDLDSVAKKLTSISEKFCHARRQGIKKNSVNLRIAADADWWLYTDLFLNGLRMEQVYGIINPDASLVCAYNIAGLLKHIGLYHLARLLETHDESVLATNKIILINSELYAKLGARLIEELEQQQQAKLPKEIRIFHKKLSEVLTNLEDTESELDIVRLEESIIGKLEREFGLD
jgi:DcmR-like sensory protein